MLSNVSLDLFVLIIRVFFFFNDTATTEIYTLSLHDALPISRRRWWSSRAAARRTSLPVPGRAPPRARPRSEEHTSELQSQSNLVCRLLLEKKKNILTQPPRHISSQSINVTQVLTLFQLRLHH